MRYKSSFYNHFITVKEKDYVYNILTTSIVQLNREIYEALKENSFENLSLDVLNALKKEGLIVEEKIDEKLVYKNFYDSIRLGESTQNLTVTIVPSYNCNLACPYCLQGSGKLVKKMSIDDIDAILKFISVKVEDNDEELPIKHLSLSLYGGEAMMNKKEITYFCEESGKIAKRNKISTDYQMTTNLTLLDDSMIDLIEKFKINVQVTLDGTREQHNKRRIKHNGEGTYDIIIENLSKLVKRNLKNQITIRINIDSENISEAEKIFNEASKFSDDVYFGFLQSFNGYNDGYKEQCISEDHQSLIVSKKFNDILSSRNYMIPQSFGKKSPCSICCRNKFYFDCNLDVYKCELLLNQPECRIGTLKRDGTIEIEGAYYEQMSFSPFEFEKCKKCKLLPICAGGCPGRKYIELGNKDGNIMLANCYVNEESLNFYLSEYIQRLM